MREVGELGRAVQEEADGWKDEEHRVRVGPGWVRLLKIHLLVGYLTFLLVQLLDRACAPADEAAPASRPVIHQEHVLAK